MMQHAPHATTGDTPTCRQHSTGHDNAGNQPAPMNDAPRRLKLLVVTAQELRSCGKTTPASTTGCLRTAAYTGVKSGRVASNS